MTEAMQLHADLTPIVRFVFGGIAFGGVFMLIALYMNERN